MSASIEDIKLTLVSGLGDVERMMRWLGERRQFLAVDVETTGLNVGHDKIKLVQLGDTMQGWALSYRDWRGVVCEALLNYGRPIVAHNLLFDSKMLAADGIRIPQALAHDSMIMTHLANPAANMGLKSAAARYVDRRALAGQHALRLAMEQGGWSWATVPVELSAYWQYATLDTCLSALIAERLYSTTPRAPYELELGVIHCLREAELAGLMVDEDYRATAELRLAGQVASLRERIATEAPGLSPGSDKQVIDTLQRMGAVLFVRTERGNLSVDKTVLEWLARMEAPYSQLALLIGRWRTAVRFLDTYVRKFAEIGSGISGKGEPVGLAVDGVLRASTKPVGARTGRMSVMEPPLQTLPRGRVVRDAIVARKDCCFVMADFSGMEMRALASDARERAMLTTYARGEDLHDFVARSLYGERFTKQERTVCKNAGFAKIYGAGIPKFAATAGIDVPTATAFMSRYDELFPGVRKYMDRVVERVRERAASGNRRGYGYVRLIDGRELPVEADEAYKGVNYRIQGSCAIVTKRKIVELDAAGLGPYFRLAVHDELLYEVPIKLAREAREVIEHVMPDRLSFPGVILEVESDVVTRWGQHYRDEYPKYVETEDPEWLT